MTREEFRDYVDFLRSQDEISYDVYSGLIYAIDTLEQEPKYCDRNICTKNEYNGIGCDECEVTKSQEPIGDLISRQDAIKAIDEKAKRIKNEDTLNGLAGAVGILFDLPSVKPQEKTGHWIGIDEEPHEVWECDHCGFVIDGSGCIDPYDYRDTYKYCPHCGAKMVEPQESEE